MAGRPQLELSATRRCSGQKGKTCAVSLTTALWRGSYHLCATATACAALPAVLLAGLGRPRYLLGLTERLGASPKLDSAPVWFHAASVGELQAFEPLARHLREHRPELPLVLSVTTPGGREAASRLQGLLAAPVFQLPADVFPFPSRALQRLKPRALVLVETEIWPNLLRACHGRDIPVAIVNGRISERSFQRYGWARPLIAEALSRVALVAARDSTDAGRLVTLGAPTERVSVTGNMKFDAATALDRLDQELPWVEPLELDAGSLLVLGSTAEGEEALLLPSLARLAERYPSLRFALAPKRPERWDAVAQLLTDSGFAVVRRSSFDDSEVPPLPAGGVLLLDSLGELARLYRHAELAFVGGSLVPHGGQNLLEPAAAGVPVLFGPQVFNFRDAESALLEAEGGFRIDVETFEEKVISLLDSPQRRESCGDNARAAVATGTGAAARTAELLSKCWSGSLG